MSILQRAKDVLKIEAEGLEYMSNQLDESFTRAIEAIISTEGRTIICGMGKSGIIGKKIAASFASTGTPSFFMHPGEAFHGDLGMVKPEDVFIAISNSGETEEVLKLLPFLRDNNNTIIAITGKTQSTLAKASHFHLNVEVPQEACPLQLAPTASTTATLAMGDALTVCLMEERNFKPEHFARFHPGGSLGRRLMSKVSDFMICKNLPYVHLDANFTSIVHSVSSGNLGLTLVDLGRQGVGIITDGDLRKAMEKHEKEVFELFAKDLVSIDPKSISVNARFQEAIEKMEYLEVTTLLVKDDENVIGVIKK